MVRKSGKNRGNYQKIGENRNFNIVIIDTESAPEEVGESLSQNIQTNIHCTSDF